MSNLANYISEILKWSNTLESELINLQKNLMSGFQTLSKKSTDEYDILFSDVQEIINRTTNLRQKLSDNKEGLILLSKSPPGIYAGVIDFLYNIFIDKSSPSVASEYRKNLRNLDRSIFVQKLEKLGPALGLDELTFPSAHRDILGSLYQELNLDEEKKNLLSSGLGTAIEFMFSTDEDAFGSALMIASQQISEAAQTEENFEKIKDRLKQELLRKLPQDAQSQYFKRRIENNIKGLKFIRLEDSERSSSTRFEKLFKKYASANQLLESIQQSIKIVSNRLSQVPSLIKKTEQLTIEEEGKDPEDIMRYYNYIKDIFGPQNPESIYSLLFDIKSLLQKMEKKVGEYASIDSEENKEEKINQTPISDQEPLSPPPQVSGSFVVKNNMNKLGEIEYNTVKRIVYSFTRPIRRQP